MSENICEKCFHRADSRRRVTEFIELRRSRGEDPNDPRFLVNDIAPRHECKMHEGYGREVGSKETCVDFFQATGGDQR